MKPFQRVQGNIHHTPGEFMDVERNPIGLIGSKEGCEAGESEDLGNSRAIKEHRKIIM